MRISDWSSDVCSSDLDQAGGEEADHNEAEDHHQQAESGHRERQVAFRIPARRNVGLHAAVDKSDELPGNPGSDGDGGGDQDAGETSEESRVGKECDSTCMTRWWPHN